MTSQPYQLQETTEDIILANETPFFQPSNPAGVDYNQITANMEDASDSSYLKPFMLNNSATLPKIRRASKGNPT